MSAEIQNILHVDMDAFFAAVEQRDQPQLRGRPVIVGAPPDRRGVVCTASYEARRFGVHSAMPSRTAYRLCPHGIFLPVRHERYREVSRAVMGIFRDITPVVEPVSIDEAFLDVSDVLQRFDSAVAIARLIKQRIRDRLGLTASVGVATNKFLAKLASDLQKPDGLTVIPSAADAIRAFLAPLPSRKIWGVGQHTADRLAKVGIRSIGDIQGRGLDILVRLLGHTLGPHIWQLAHGIDQRCVQAEAQPEKSISNEETFDIDCDEPHIVRQTLVRLAEKVGRRLRRSGKTAAVAHLKVRFADFRTITRQMPILSATQADRELLDCAQKLLQKVPLEQPVRLVGFGVSDIRGADGQADPAQPLLFRPADGKQERQNRALDAVVDELRERYGIDILERAWWPATSPQRRPPSSAPEPPAGMAPES